MRLWTTLLLSFGLALPAAAMSCSSDPPADNTSSGAPGDDDDDSTSGSSGKTSSSGNGSTSSSGQTATAFTVTTSETMEFEGIQRRYLLQKPKEYDANKKYPLVLNFHGNPAKPEDQVAAMPFDSVTKQDAIVAYPGAANGSDWQFQNPSDGNPDMAWIGPLIQEIAKKVNIDPANAMGFGYSGGAYFLSQYACRVGGVLKMVAFYAGGAPDQRAGDNKRENDCVICPAGPVPMFIAHGVNDNSEVSFAAGDYARWCWGDTNGCTYNEFSGGTEPCKKASNCTEQPLTWCPVPDTGHEPWQPAMQQAWDMFKALP